jgi:hypothetical protein
MVAVRVMRKADGSRATIAISAAIIAAHAMDEWRFPELALG